MSTYWVKQRLNGNPNVVSIADVDPVILNLKINTNQGQKEYLVYKADKGDYVLTVENVQEAESKHANVMVYDSWGEITQAAKNLAKQKGISVYHFGVFIKLITEGKRL